MHLRRKLFSATDLTFLAAQPQATKTRAVWGMSLEESQTAPPDDVAWRLWPKEVPFAEILENAQQGDRVQMKFAYTKALYGKHPLLQRHACRVTISHLRRPLQAYATMTAYSRQQWEADALTLACVIQSMTKLSVSVSGFITALPALYDTMGNKRAANAYLSDLATTAMAEISVDEGIQIDEFNIADLGWIPKREVTSRLDHKWELTTKVAQFHKEAFQCYPQAHRISSRGRTFEGFRGGSSGGPVGVWVRGGVACVCVCRLHVNQTHSEGPFFPYLPWWGKMSSKAA